jgi:hypothetical protein
MSNADSSNKSNKLAKSTNYHIINPRSAKLVKRISLMMCHYVLES